MSVKDEWDRLDSETRTWLLENPGCLILPRTMSAKMMKEARTDLKSDPHGQIVLSQADHEFIREKAEAAGTIRVHPMKYQFFDSAPLPNSSRASAGRRAPAGPNEAP